MTSKPKTTVTFYNGLTTIGGPMIEVAYDKSHVLLDLGEVYRPELGLKMEDEDFSTLLKYQLIGDVPNFYDPKITGKEIDHERWQHSAAYISHLHFRQVYHLLNIQLSHLKCYNHFQNSLVNIH